MSRVLQLLSFLSFFPVCPSQVLKVISLAPPLRRDVLGLRSGSKDSDDHQQLTVCPATVASCIDFAQKLELTQALLVLSMDAPGRCSTLATNAKLRSTVPSAWKACEAGAPQQEWFCCGTPSFVFYPPNSHPALLLRFRSDGDGSSGSIAPTATRPADGGLGLDAREFGCSSEVLRLNIIISAAVYQVRPEPGGRCRHPTRPPPSRSRVALARWRVA